jgi:hypothetical protein
MLAASARAEPPSDVDPDLPVEALFPDLEARFLRQGIDEGIPWGCFALPGQPGFRTLLGRFFSPPLLRFADAELAAPDAAWRDGNGLDNPWPVDGAALAVDVHRAAARVAVLDAELRIISPRTPRHRRVAGWRAHRRRCVDRVGWSFTLRVTAYHLIRLPKLLAAPA